MTAKLKESELERILSNLINNSIEAIDFSTGQIACSFYTSNDFFELSITDTGKGIPSEVVENLGQMGFSVGKESSASSGSGIGLFHAKKTLEEVGGQLLISSIPRQGTTVKIQIPKL